ncbi:MAG: hypothetical protein R2687_03120 [Candidatus Nanopelagicales bacterium]
MRALRIARTCSIVMAPSANAVAVSGSTSRRARAVWTHQPACPGGCGGFASQSPVVRCPANCAPPRVSNEGRQRPGLHRASCCEGVDVQDRAFELVQGPFRRIRGQQLVDWEASLIHQSGSVTVIVMSVSHLEH